MQIDGLSGIFGWRDMPSTVRDRISTDIQAVAKDAHARSLIEANGQRVLGSSPDEFSAAIEQQRARIEQINRIVDLKKPTD
jgi:tripartite-type tricarboxylate transporter receptor subunit TctC